MRISDWSSDVCSSDLSDFQAIGTDRWSRNRGKRRIRSEFRSDPIRSKLALGAPGIFHPEPEISQTAPIRRAGHRAVSPIMRQSRLPAPCSHIARQSRSEENTSELQSPMRISYAGFRLKKKKAQQN